MTLPGKLCIGIVEEDNPLKSYFRFKPLLIATAEGYETYDVGGDFPENGCIRIVPDKNESSRFKARMRRMGGFCEVDLREHPDDNDKIRPNKNYRGDEGEPNAYIIYSDVVREPAEGHIVELLTRKADGDEATFVHPSAPHTHRIALIGGGEVLPALWTHAPNAEGEGVVFTRTAVEGEFARAQRFDVPGLHDQTLSFLIAPPDGELYRTAQPTPPAPRPVVPRPVERPAVAEAPMQAEVAQEIEPAPEKPWITHDAKIVPKFTYNPNLSPREQEMAMQTGINPRRGRSLKEIIDEKWRHSRIDQLGHPVPGQVMGSPVVSPVDRAVEAVAEAWEHLDARACLAQALSRVDGLAKAVCGGEDVREGERRAARLREFEAARTSLTTEVERLKRDRDEAKAEIARQVREESASELEAHASRVRELEALEAELRARAEDSRRVAEAAERAVGDLTDEKLETRLSEFAVNCRAIDLIALAKTGGADARHGARTDLRHADSITVPELTRAVLGAFSAAGFSLTGDEAVNLLACFSLGDALLITGPSGCGKTATARLLTRALGLWDAGRVSEWREGEDIGRAEPSELVQVVIADDVNACPNACARAVAELSALPAAKAILTAQDSAEGFPLPTRLLDRSFLYRLKPESAAAPWGRPPRADAQSEFVVTRAALSALFQPDERHIAPQVARRMQSLRAELAKYGVLLSRRALEALWLYCAAVTPHLTLTPFEAFDLAFAQRALPAVLSMAGVEALHALPELLEGMPRSLELLRQPLAIEV